MRFGSLLPGGDSSAVSDRVLADCCPLRLIDAEVMYLTAPYPGFQLARGCALLQLVKHVGDIPAAVNHTHNLNHAGTLAVEDEIFILREQSQPKSSVTTHIKIPIAVCLKDNGSTTAWLLRFGEDPKRAAGHGRR
jgi:hypothetical protein